MQSDFLDRELYKMAEQEQMAVPEDLDARVDDILQHLEKSGRGSRHHYSFRRAAILAAACLVLASATVTASGMYQARMESMNHEKLEEYFAQLQEANASADSYSRPMTESETARLEELRQAYLEQGYFPKKELTLIDSPEKYKKGVAFYTERSTFFLPDAELTDEQLLELIDFKEKREYSLAKISEEIEAGSYEYVKTEPEKDAVQQGRTAQQGTSGTVLDADTATQEWQIAYVGDVSIRCAAVAENGLYVGGFTTGGQARVEYLPYGSGTPKTIFEDFVKNGEVYSLCTAPDGSIYAGLKGLAAAGAEHGWLPEIYHISPEGTLLNSFTVGEREWNIVDSMATDAQGRLYVRMRMQEDGSYVRIYSAEGELIGTVADDNNYAVQGAGALGQGKDGKVYAAAQAVGDTTAGDMAMTLVSVDPESLRFVPLTESENVICSADTIYPWKILSYGDTTAWTPIIWARRNSPECRRAGRCPAVRKAPVRPSYRTVAFSTSAHPAVFRELLRTAWRSAEKILRRQCSIMSHSQNRVTINWRHRETDAASFKVPDC